MRSSQRKGPSTWHMTAASEPLLHEGGRSRTLQFAVALATFAVVKRLTKVDRFARRDARSQSVDLNSWFRPGACRSSSRGEFHPPGSHGTGRKPLGLSGSCHPVSGPAAGELPVGKQCWFAL
jgi:hypothetical protein